MLLPRFGTILNLLVAREAGRPVTLDMSDYDNMGIGSNYNDNVTEASSTYLPTTLTTSLFNQYLNTSKSSVTNDSENLSPQSKSYEDNYKLDVEEVVAGVVDALIWPIVILITLNGILLLLFIAKWASKCVFRSRGSVRNPSLSNRGGRVRPVPSVEFYTLDDRQLHPRHTRSIISVAGLHANGGWSTEAEATTNAKELEVESTSVSKFLDEAIQEMENENEIQV
ncbi:uncharacterized protein LOC132193183 [Neocloeon triangulifer]|uniref:uncharacterized protein LOC132193183 n=1 Tax=Neocloeon triangulifer TaxID=2078957 RepID=UPI00286F2894|nr:uncharacterized protein LOC132193183 [Neocloeon triangulifer]